MPTHYFQETHEEFHFTDVQQWQVRSYVCFDVLEAEVQQSSA